MEQFLGLSKDASKEKSEAGTSPYNRNIVYNKRLGSITQEDGFDFSHQIPGIVIGVYSTNTHIIYISYNVTTTRTLISYVDTTTNIINTVIDTVYFGYDPSRPVEIIGWYNYNQELLIMFSDGVFEQSSEPRLINLMDINVTLDLNKEFLTQKDADTTLLFSRINVPIFNIEYGNRGLHDCDLLFFTIAYVLVDGTTTTKFFPSLVQAFPLYAFKEEYKREIIFKIKDLDTFFNQFIIGIVAYRDNALFGYTTDPISFTSLEYDYSFISVSDLNSVSVDSIIIEASIFERVKSLTIGNDTVLLGGMTTKDSNKYQKYANNLKLDLYFDERKNNNHQAPLLCPDEVYYFTIALAFHNGTFSEEFHIPGEEDTVFNTLPLNKNVYGLNDILDESLLRFHVLNTGGWVNLTRGLPNFNNLEELKLNWGYWQNEELYPNTPEYNGTVDYDNTILLNGRDLRNTNVKLHRVPGLDTLNEKFPMGVGIDIKNENLIKDTHTRLPAFSIKVNNFLEVFDSVIIKDNIKGYRLSFVKKDSTSKLVEDINFIKPIQYLKIEVERISKEVYSLYNNYYPWNATNVPIDSKTISARYAAHGHSKVYSINQSLYKGGSSAKIIKANYGVLPININNIEDITYNNRNTENEINKKYRTFLNDKETIGIKGNNILLSQFNKYATIQNIIQVAGNVDAENNIFSNEHIRVKARNTNTTYPATVTVPDYGWRPLGFIPTFPNPYFTRLTESFPFFVYNKEASDYTIQQVILDDIAAIELCTTFLNIKKNLHTGLNPNSFVTVGFTNLSKADKIFKNFGDTFSNNIYNDISSYINLEGVGSLATQYAYGVFYLQNIYSGLLSIDNNTLISGIKDRLLGYLYLIDRARESTNAQTTDTSELLTFNYIIDITNKQTTRQLNTLIANTAFNFNKKYINKFPYRIAKSLTIQSENLSTANVRTFLANAYYDMPSIRGEIIYLVGFDKGVYCQQRYSLSMFQLKEKLSNNDENTAYLAEADLFAYKPQTIVDEDNKGYIGSVHQFGKKLSKNGLVTVDAERGQVYIITGNEPKELSKIKMENFFREELELLLNYIVPNLFNTNALQDNPYNGNGLLIGIDDKNNRILISINNYQIKESINDEELITILNGLPYNSNNVLLDIKNSQNSINKSKTLSFNTDWQRWVSEHDYYPQFYVNTNKANYAGINNEPSITLENNDTTYRSDIYITNNKAKTGKYFYKTDFNIYESFTDLLFNSRYDLTKWYKSVLWRTTVNNETNKNIYDKTINAILLYTDYQCSGRIELDTEQFNLVRNSEGIWNFNEFRDMVIDSNDLPISEDGLFDVNKVYLDRVWFEKSDFISNFIIIRLIMNNIENTRTHIHNVNVESRISNRI